MPFASPKMFRFINVTTVLPYHSACQNNTTYLPCSNLSFFDVGGSRRFLRNTVTSTSSTGHDTHKTLKTVTKSVARRVPLMFKTNSTYQEITRELRSSGLLRSVWRLLLTDVSGHPTGPIFRGQEFKLLGP